MTTNKKRTSLYLHPGTKEELKTLQESTGESMNSTINMLIHQGYANQIIKNQLDELSKKIDLIYKSVMKI